MTKQEQIRSIRGKYRDWLNPTDSEETEMEYNIYVPMPPTKTYTVVIIKK